MPRSDDREVAATMRAGWSSGALRVALCFAALGALGLYLLAIGATAPALGVGLAGVALAVGLLLLTHGSCVDATETMLHLRLGFLPYSFPWSDVRGFVVDRRSPSGVYVAALHPRRRTLMLFEVPPVRTSSPLALASRLNDEARRRRRASGTPPTTDGQNGDDQDAEDGGSRDRAPRL